MTGSRRTPRVFRRALVGTAVGLCVLLAGTAGATARGSADPPTVKITSSPSSPTTSTTATIAFAVKKADKVKCSLDAGKFSSCSSPVALSGLAVGSHSFVVQATGNGGLSASAQVTWQVVGGGGTPPPPPPPPPAFSVSSSIADGATLTGALVWEAKPSQAVSKVDFYIDSVLKWTEIVAPYIYNGDGNTLDTKTLSNGSHALKVVATATGGATAALSVTVQVANGSSSPPPGGAGSAGHVLYMAPKADNNMAVFINNATAAQKQWFQDHWQRAIVIGGYWDSKLSWYSNAWAYMDAYAIYNPSSVATQHPDWILKDAAGNKLYIPWGCSGGSCPQYAADIGSSAWRQDYINRCKALVALGYKGIYVDDVDMDMNVGNGSGQQVAPIDPRTGAAMTDAAWKGYFAAFLEQLRAAIPGAEITHNALWFAGGGQHDGTQADIAREIKAADYVNVERGFADSGLTGGTGVWSVFALMRFIDNVHAYGRHVVLQSTANDATTAEYNLAGYFLVSDGKDYVSSSLGSMPTNAWSGYSTNLGDATSGRYQWNGVWRRDFTRGFVLLNEPGASTKSLALGGTFKNTAGNSVSSVTLGAAQGAVLAS